jgi:LAO/AO transport system kinase
MTDLFLLLLSPGGGDDLQGIKRGVMELADILLVTKADGDLAAAASRAAADYRLALRLMRPKHKGLHAQVLTVSALEGAGIGECWAAISAFRVALAADDRLTRQRAEQARNWFWNEVQSTLTERILSDPALGARANVLEGEVAAGAVLPQKAARTLLSFLEGGPSKGA